MADPILASLARWSPDAVLKLRRLGLLEEATDSPYELLRDFSPREASRIADASGVATAAWAWGNCRNANSELSATSLLVILEHFRQHPHEFAGVEALGSIDDELAVCAYRLAGKVYDIGRIAFVEADVDVAMNRFRLTQAEFLFAQSSGLLKHSATVQALGKYAVAVGFTSRWARASMVELRRARAFQEESIRGGNSQLEAYKYLVEILVETFNQSGAAADLEEALDLAETHEAQLARSELLLKRGIMKQAARGASAISDLQMANRLADTFRPVTGTEFVQRALLKDAALSAIAWGGFPLPATEVRFPFGVLGAVESLAWPDAERLLRMMSDALEPMRQELQHKNTKPNRVIQLVLSSVYEQGLKKDPHASRDLANRLLAVTGEDLQKADAGQYLRWRHAEALATCASKMADPQLYAEAVAYAQNLTTTYPSAPLPRITLARILDGRAAIARGDSDGEASSIAWQTAVDLVVGAPEYRRIDLGGRAGVYAVEDARGDLSTSFVFKPVSSIEVGLGEAERLENLAATIHDRGAEERFGAPASFGVFNTSTGTQVHVIARQTGRLLSSMPRDIAAGYLSQCAELLAFFHLSSPPGELGRSAWQPLRPQLRTWYRALARDADEIDAFVQLMRDSLPASLKLYRKRDAHAANWVVEPGGRIVAIDLEASSYLPVGHDLAQLVEDNGLLPLTPAGWSRRLQLLDEYLGHLKDDDLGTVDREDLYAWFALYRAVWLATDKRAGKALHEHARSVAQHVAEVASSTNLRDAASLARRAMSRYWAELTETKEIAADHRRLSKAMSSLLRHRAPTAGVAVDRFGYVTIEELASTLGSSADAIAAVAQHPSEPRFQVEDERIRARYGHSFRVDPLDEHVSELPTLLYHGTSWDSLARIAESGLRPMSRQNVHLSNNPLEALEVARRHGRPLLLAVDPDGVEGLQAVADAMWAAPSVPVDRLRILNAFTEVASPPGWLSAPVRAGS